MRMTAYLMMYAFEKSFKTVSIIKYNTSLCDALIHCYYSLFSQSLHTQYIFSVKLTHISVMIEAINLKSA
jgi:hypothetical protein